MVHSVMLNKIINMTPKLRSIDEITHNGRRLEEILFETTVDSR